MTPEQLRDALDFPHLKRLFTAPGRYWQEELEQPTDIESMLVPRILFLAALPAVATFMGNSFRLAFILPTMGMLAALLSGILSYALNVGIWFALGMVINLLAESFEAEKGLGTSLKLASGALIPAWLGGLLWMVPWLGHVLGPVGSLAGLGYGSYALYQGLPLVNGTSRDKALVFTVSAMAILFVLFLFLSWMTFCPASCLVMSRPAFPG